MTKNQIEVMMLYWCIGYFYFNTPANIRQALSLEVKNERNYVRSCGADTG